MGGAGGGGGGWGLGGNLTQIALSLMVFKITDIFHFRQNSRWRPKIGKVKNFQRCQSSSPVYPGGPKFAKNCSISYGFRDK